MSADSTEQTANYDIETRRRLGDILVAEEVITREQLDQALGRQQGEGGALGAVLREMGLASDNEIQQALGRQMGMEVVDVAKLTIPDEAIEKVDRMTAETFRILPIRWDEGQGLLVVAMADPMNVHALDNLRFMLNCRVEGAVSEEQAVREAIDQYYGSEDSESIDEIINQIKGGEIDVDEGEGMDEEGLENLANQMPVIRLLNLVLLTAIKEEASDVHFEPYEDSYRIRYRIDGALLELKSPPKTLSLALTSRIKVMARLNIAERRLPQDGRITLSLGQKVVDLRVSTLPTMFGESVVIRILDKSVVSLNLDQVGLRDDDMEAVEDLIRRPNGVVLVTGPTGSGKTTTLYACLNRINDISKKIITTEDPVEYEIQGIVQVPIRSDIGVTYAKCLRSILRQDPDIILVGEIRDKETSDIAIEASLTGHLVFSTLHTQDAPGTVARLIEIGAEPYLLAATLESVIAQRLVRLICTHCKTPYNPTEQELLELGFQPEEVENRSFYYGVGCEHCRKTGYRGRTALFEILKMSPRLREEVLNRKSTEVLRNTAREEGMMELRDAGLYKIFDGLTTIEEVVKETMYAD